jgi:hypothetical protein
MRNHQCSCGCGEPYRNSPSSFPSALSTTILGFPQVFSGFLRFCSYSGTFYSKNPSKIEFFTSSTPSSHAHFVEATFPRSVFDKFNLGVRCGRKKLRLRLGDHRKTTLPASPRHHVANPFDHAMMYYGDAHAVNMERRHPFAQTMAGMRIFPAHNGGQETGLHVLDVLERLGRNGWRLLRRRKRRRTTGKQERTSMILFVCANSHPLDAHGHPFCYKSNSHAAAAQSALPRPSHRIPT